MKFDRPESLQGFTLRVNLDTHIYITANYDEYGIVEIFNQPGRTKSKSKEKAKIESDLKAHSEAVSRLISRALQQTRTIESRQDVLQTLGKTMRGIQGSASGYNAEGILLHSVPDAIGWILQGCPDREGKPTLDTTNYPGPKQ